MARNDCGGFHDPREFISRVKEFGEPERRGPPAPSFFAAVADLRAYPKFRERIVLTGTTAFQGRRTYFGTRSEKSFCWALKFWTRDGFVEIAI